MVRRKPDDPRFYVWHSEPNRVIYYAKRTGESIDWTMDIQQASLFTLKESDEMQQSAAYNWECSYTHYENIGAL